MVMLIYKKIIENYVKTTLSPEIIIDYAYKNNFMLSSRDSIIIYNFIKRNYKFILNGDESSFKDLEQQLDKDLYKKIKELHIYYKSKLT